MNIRSASLFILTFIISSVLAVSSCTGAQGAGGNQSVKQWDVFEVELKGPSAGNPFLDVTLSASFTHKDSVIMANGFYDGDGTYRIRFMPHEPGRWSYVTSSNTDELNNISGAFTVGEPSAGEHGPVRVVDTYHFAYADGKRFFPVGTTLYCWTMERYDETLATLKNANINKVRFMPFPHSGNTFPPYNPWQGSVNNWDFDRPNPQFWRFMENAVKELRDMGVQADLIFFHPYESGDRQTWGLGPEQMTATQRENYLKYAVARLAAYHNVWWSMANEYNDIDESTSYWEPLAAVVANADPYGHMHSIHGYPNLHYPGWDNAWVTHISIQSPDVTDISSWREQYQKPVIDDEYQYEGNWKPWGALTGEEATRRIWTATIEGGYATHGESYRPYSFFWKGGTPQRDSFARVSWLSGEVLNNDDKPLPGGLENIDNESAHHDQDYYLYYYGSTPTSEKTYVMPEGMKYKVDVLDTWNMTVTAVDGTYSGTFTISWPEAKYIAVRIYNIDLVKSASSAPKKIPVILDTDIGDDIDDTWALVMLLKSPEFDIKMIIGDNHNSIYRAKIIAKMLEIAGRTDIPIGMAYSTRQEGGNQSEWVKDYDLTSYAGKIYEDGVGALIDIITKFDEKITVIAIGPVTNLAEALKREPSIAEKANFVGMHGSVYLGYGGSEEISAEYNVKVDVEACQRVFAAPWDMVITPLDTCGLVHLSEGNYARVRDSNELLTRALVENYRIWLAETKNEPVRTDENQSSTLFDTVAVYLAFSDALCEMETLGIVVDDEGYTRIKEGAKEMKVATKWKDLNGFEELLAERIVGPVVKP